jgi:predicted amidohydrolase YtcJ
MDAGDLIVRNARVTTLHGSSADAEALAVRGEKFLAVGARPR